MKYTVIVERTYGSPRIHQKLLREDYHLSKKRVERLRREAGIHAMAKKKYESYYTDSKHTLPVAANSLNRNFSVNKPNQSWVADITCIYIRKASSTYLPSWTFIPAKS
jgi:transposase InsO family protein